MTLNNKGINTLLVNAARELLTNGSDRYNERTGSKITEIRDYVMKGNPNYRYITLGSRKNNLCATVVEMMMVLSGNPDLKYLSLFLPRAIEYSDDGGLTWRGNYGIRIRGNKAFEGEQNESYQFVAFNSDELKRVIECLSKDKSSRQEFITIGFSQLDRNIVTKDTPCTMTLVFGIDSNNLVTLTTFMRSNDIIFGFSGVNYFIFTCLQELVASCLNLDLGDYCHHPVSLHVYDNYYKNLVHISEEKPTEIRLINGLFSGIESLDNFDTLARNYFSLLENPGYSCHELSKLLYSDETKINNLRSLLVATYGYLHHKPKDEVYNVIRVTANDPDNIIKLLDRDIFFNKRCN